MLRLRSHQRVPLVFALLLACAACGASEQRHSPVIETRDGVRLAADIALPGRRAEHLPAILVMTRYGRGSSLSGAAIAAFTAKGFAVVLVDMRGSGASGGYVRSVFSAEERRDIYDVLDWISKQPWSDGRVIATGVSYDANLADLAVASLHPALRAAVPRFIDFDTYRELVFPGGVRNEMLLREWGALTRRLDLGEPCLESVSACGTLHANKPVDGDGGFTQLRAALADHKKNWDAYRDTLHYAYYDDVAPSGEPFSSGFLSAQAALRSSHIPLQIWGSWFDARTADAALEQYRLDAGAPIELFLGAWTHGGGANVDPFHPAGGDDAVKPAQRFLAFAQASLSGRPMARTIHYYVAGAAEWRETATWPPKGTTESTWYLSKDHVLGDRSSADSDEDRYAVDFSATTGKSNRWTTQLGGTPVDYGDRRAADQALLVYTSSPLSAAIEVTGTPRAVLYVSSDQTDGALFVYLEAVAPDGRVLYLSEGEQRLALLGRTSADEADPGKGYRRRDLDPLVPGRTVEVDVPLAALAARIPPAYRLRLAIAGADADTFARYPVQGTAVLRLKRGGAMASRLTLPVAPTSH